MGSAQGSTHETDQVDIPLLGHSRNARPNLGRVSDISKSANEQADSPTAGEWFGSSRFAHFLIVSYLPLNGFIFFI
jgi:hypothetical protein